MSRWSPDERIDTVKIDLECLTERVIELEEELSNLRTIAEGFERFRVTLEKFLDMPAAPT